MICSSFCTCLADVAEMKDSWTETAVFIVFSTLWNSKQNNKKQFRKRVHPRSGLDTKGGQGHYEPIWWNWGVLGCGAH